MLFWRQNTRLRIKLRSSHGSPHRAWRDAHLRIIANPLGLPHVAASHHIEPAAFFSKPHGSRDAHSGLAKRCQGNIFPTLNGRGNLARHKLHSKIAGQKGERSGPLPIFARARLARNLTEPIAPVMSYVLQA